MHLAFRGRNKVPLPPGPRKIPILGNVHMLPFEGQEHTFAEWGKRYGDVIYAKLFRRTTIIVNSFNASRDLMDKRSGNYSDRPPFILLGMMGWEKVLNLLPYGDEFRKQRKWVQDAFQSKKSLQNYRPLQQRAVVELLNRLLDNPGSFDAHFTRYLASIIMEITYGHRVVNEDDKFVGIAERATTETALIGSAGSMLVDFFPILKHFPSWMPGGRFKKKVTHARKCIRDMYDVPYNMALGVAWPSFTSSLLEECITDGKLSRNDEDSIKGAAANLYGGGTETTATVLTIFVLLMVTHPHVYKRLQEEMDKVIGSERLPDFDDRPHLPFLDATIKETLRWHTPVPLG
ncbi:hypothetical protein QCA50_009806 [Cerrena zonata]|uniref:Cytochrome P450 n=1 Tax=Cerrena zonata TaxID=2478898 RepID=A0AAW0GCG1_9APHY